MENPGVEIRSVQLADGNIIVQYENDAVETLSNSKETFVAFYNFWIKDNPPFISDSHKLEMRNLTLVSINNNEKSISEMMTYFQAPNEENVKKFLSYMRKRVEILPEKKAIWTVVQ
jgi:hypothetical protein